MDGLDEIADPAARERVVTTIAADAGRDQSPYRWVVTSRGLPPGELEPLWRAGMGHYLLTPFDEDRLRKLARGWLADLATGTAIEALVEDFLHQAEDSGLRQLIMVPLLATLTLVVFSRRSGQGLPTGCPGLYREFVSYLLSGRDGETERRVAFGQAALATGAGTESAEWLYQNRAALLMFLARQTVSADPPLLTEALAWITAHAPELPEFVLGWSDIVLGLLTGTGLLISDDSTGELQWIHRSFAEYLAVRDLADDLPADWPGPDPDADSFLRGAIEGVGQDLSVLAIACWVENHATSVGPLLHFLMSKSDDYELHLKYHGGGIIIGADSSRVDSYAALAGRLLAEGIVVPEVTSERVLNRLLERAQSVFTARYFCSIVATQPQRHIAGARCSKWLPTAICLSRSEPMRL